MSILLVISVGWLMGVGSYLMLMPHLARFAMGLVCFTNGVNLLIFSAGRLTRALPPIIAEGESQLRTPSANPLSQALILTAIVIGFGFLSFVLALAFKVSSELGSVESDGILGLDEEAG